MRQASEKLTGKKKPFFRRQELTREIRFPETHSLINSTLLMPGRCYSKQNPPAEVESLLRECGALRLAALPPIHWLISNAKDFPAKCLLQLKRFDEVTRLSRKSYEILLGSLGANHEHTKLAKKD